jgi:hypothetical protein
MKNKTEETEQSDKEGYNVLIASHSEDLDWLRFLPKERDYKVIVSNSNERKKIDNCDLVLNRENFGREAGHYFNYIVETYDDLPETTVFMQADPWPHSAAGNYILTLMEIFFGNPEFVWPVCYLGKTYSPSQILCVPESSQYKALKFALQDHPMGKGLPISIGANFYAKRKTILSRPKEVYQRFLEYAKDKSIYPNDPYSTLAHDLEGVWGGVFHHQSSRAI